MTQYLLVIVLKWRKNMYKSASPERKVCGVSQVDGIVPPWTAKWMYKISLSLMSVDIRAKDQHWVNRN